MTLRGNLLSQHRQRQGTQLLLAERLHAILADRGLTLYQVSQRSAARFGRYSPYFIPHNLYYDLRRGSFTPNIQQVFALSTLSGYSLHDWFRVFGIDLENILYAQVMTARKRTILLDTSLTDRQRWICGLRNREGVSTPQIAALAHLLKRNGPIRIASVPGSDAEPVLFVQIGSDDDLAFPDLVPGSLVRINPRLTLQDLPVHDGQVSKHIFLLRHSKGLFCARVRKLATDLIVPVATELSYAQTELRLPSEADLLGVADLEIRPLLTVREPKVPEELARHWSPRRLASEQTASQLLHSARQNNNLSFREAAAMTRKFADLLGDQRFRISPSSLCDYEVEAAPRNLHKIASLCCVCALPFTRFLSAMGMDPAEAGCNPMPDNFVGRRIPSECEQENDNRADYSGFLAELGRAFGKVPFFLSSSFPHLAGFRNASIEDVFWIGDQSRVLHSYFSEGLLAIVNQRKKRPQYFPAQPLWKQPVYLLLERDGSYACACCSLENGILVIHPHTEHFYRTVRFQNRKDIEVIGQITAIARRLT